MALVLRIESTQTDVPLTLPGNGLVEADHSLTIGRATDNDLVLEGETISKRHCTIHRDDTRYVLVDHSRNGTFLNRGAEALSRDIPVPLKSGDFIHIGSFDLAVVAAAVPGADRPAAGVESRGDNDASRGEPSFLGVVAPIASPHAHLANIDPGGLMSRREEPLVIEDDDYGPASPDLLDDPFTGPSRNRRDRDDDMLPSRRLDPGEPPSAYADHVAVPNMFFVQPKVYTEPIPEDWDLMAEMGRPASLAAAQPVLPETGDEPAPASTSSRLPEAETTLAVGEGGMSREKAAIAAFLDGCGISAEECDKADLATVMGRAGRALRLSIANLHDILDARTSAKEGFGVERTMLGRSGNNPLKFVADPHDALMALLVTTIPGFLVAEEAVEQAFTDIKEHQISMLTAMQAALASVCRQLAPETIERAVGAPTALERLVLRARSERRWHAYRVAFDDVTTGLDNNARHVFGSDFASAYHHGTASAGLRPSGTEDGRLGKQPAKDTRIERTLDGQGDADVG